MTSGKEKLIPIFAIAVLLIGIISTIYVNANENHERLSDKILMINGNVYSFKELFSVFQNVTINTEDGEKTGLPLEKIISFTGVNCPTCKKYTFKANDNYQQTVLWKDVKTGILTYEKNHKAKVYFPNLAHTFWVYKLIEIEVNEL